MYLVYICPYIVLFFPHGPSIHSNGNSINTEISQYTHVPRWLRPPLGPPLSDYQHPSCNGKSRYAFLECCVWGFRTGQRRVLHQDTQYSLLSNLDGGSTASAFPPDPKTCVPCGNSWFSLPCSRWSWDRHPPSVSVSVAPRLQQVPPPTHL